MHKNVDDEVFYLASEVLRRFGDKDKHKCNIALERAEFMNDEDFVYSFTETPYYLEEHGLAEILSEDWAFVDSDYWSYKRFRVTGDYYRPKVGSERKMSIHNSLSLNNVNVKGFYALAFNIDALETWFDNQLDKRIGSSTRSIHFESKPEDWHWEDIEKNSYKFGNHGVFTQSGKIRGLIFKEAMKLFNETTQSISINKLSQRTGIKSDRIRIEISGINNRFKKIGLSFNGTGDGFYIISKVVV